MTIEISKVEGKTILLLSGRLDTTTAVELQEALVPLFDTESNIQLDLSDLEYVSSAGLRVLLIGQKTADSKNAFLSVTGVSEDIMEVFEMTGFADILEII